MLVGLAALVLLAAAVFQFRYLLLSRLHLGWGEDEGALGLRHVEDVQLPGGASRLDYQGLDAARGLLFIAHLGADQVIAYDVHADRVAGVVSGVASPHGLTLDPGHGRAWVSATGTGDVVAIDEGTFAVVARVHVGGEPDGMAFDAATGRLFVSDEGGDGDVVVDTEHAVVVGRIDLGGAAGNTQDDVAGSQVVVAAEAKGQLAFIDPHTMAVEAWMDLPGCRGAHGVALDAARRAYVACEGNAALLVVDLSTRSVLARFSVGDVPDVLAFDGGASRLYVASESGVVAVFSTAGDVAKAGQAYLAPAAHTVAVDPDTHRLYFPLEDIGGAAVLRIEQA